MSKTKNPDSTQNQPWYSTHELNIATAVTGTVQIIINSAQHMLQEIISPAR